MDESRRVYKLQGERWSGISGFLNPNVWKAHNRAVNKGFEGNMKGEGLLMGGLFIISPEKGVLLEYREAFFGDHAPLETVFESCMQLPESVSGAEATESKQ